MVKRILITGCGTVVGVGAALCVVALAAWLMSPPSKVPVWGCADMEGNTFVTTEAEIQTNSPMLKVLSSINGERVPVYIPAVTLKGCLEVPHDSGSK